MGEIQARIPNPPWGGSETHDAGHKRALQTSGWLSKAAQRCRRTVCLAHATCDATVGQVPSTWSACHTMRSANSAYRHPFGVSCRGRGLATVAMKFTTRVFLPNPKAAAIAEAQSARQAQATLDAAAKARLGPGTLQRRRAASERCRKGALDVDAASKALGDASQHSGQGYFSKIGYCGSGWTKFDRLVYVCVYQTQPSSTSSGVLKRCAPQASACAGASNSPCCTSFSKMGRSRT